MNKIATIVLRICRRGKSKWYTFLCKKMLHSYGSVGCNGYTQISSTAKVDVGHHVSFNGAKISGWGGGKNRQLFSLGYKCKDNVGKSRL